MSTYYPTEKEGNVIQKAKMRASLVKNIELEYRSSEAALYVKGEILGTGSTSLAITNSYYSTLETQLKNVKSQLSPLIKKFFKNNVTITIEVTDTGELNLENLNVIIRIPIISFSGNVDKVFKEPFRILRPFVDYTNSISLKGHQFKPSVIFANLTLSLEDLIEVVDYPIYGPRTEEQWYAFATSAMHECRRQYNFNITLPCIEGELYWDAKEKQVIVQHRESY